jgi:exodeoxyribonuclease VII small subunit
MSAKAKSTEDVGYAEAVSELEEILVELEADDVDVDRLAESVRRAADLIELCRGRLTDARVEITRIVADLETLETDEVLDAEDE